MVSQHAILAQFQMDFGLLMLCQEYGIKCLKYSVTININIVDFSWENCDEWRIIVKWTGISSEAEH
jgi:hypothetical protein